MWLYEDGERNEEFQQIVNTESKEGHLYLYTNNHNKNNLNNKGPICKRKKNA